MQQRPGFNQREIFLSFFLFLTPYTFSCCTYDTNQTQKTLRGENLPKNFQFRSHFSATTLKMATFMTFFVRSHFLLSYPCYRSAPKCRWKEAFSLTETNTDSSTRCTETRRSQSEPAEKTPLYIETGIFVCFKVKHTCIKYAFAYAKYCIHVYNYVCIFRICMRKNRFQCYVNIKRSIKMCSSASSLWLVTAKYIISVFFFV